MWPALLPPWKRTTASACSASRSVTFPFPSSPHWAPTITIPDIYVECTWARGGGRLRLERACGQIRRATRLRSGADPASPIELLSSSRTSPAAWAGEMSVVSIRMSGSSGVS